MDRAPAFTPPAPSAAFPFESRYLRVLGHRIHYVEVGAGTPVLFFHGNPTSSYLWRNVIGPLAAATRSRVLAFDLLGFGKSDKPARLRHTLALHADVVTEFIGELGLKDLIVVADDWGGPLAMHYAVYHPHKVRGAVLMETFLWPMTWAEDFSPEFRAPFRLMRSPLGAVLNRTLNLMTKKLIPQHCPISPQALQHYIDACPTFASRNAMASFPKLLPVEGKPAESHAFFLDLQRALQSFKAPVAWIKASPGVVPSEDYPPQRKRLGEVQALLPQLEILDFGPGHHFLAEEHPERVSELVSGFVNRVRAQRPTQA